MYVNQFAMLQMTKEEHEEYNRFYAEHHISDLKRDEVGNLILCENREDTSTRLYIHRMNKIDDIFRKDGWWDTFTISKSACDKKGFYICKIDDFRIDRNGFLNMLVSPKAYLGTEIDVDSDAWDYFLKSGLFTFLYSSRSSCHRTRFNVAALHKMFEEDILRIKKEQKERLGDQYIDASKEIASLVLDKYLSGKVTLEQIEQALDEKEVLEKLAEDFNFQLSRYGVSEKNKYAEYPLLLKKLPTDDGIFKGYYTTTSTMRYLDRKNYEYDRLNLGTETDMLKRIEAVLQYWVDVKAKEKEEKKKKRKAMKNS